MSAIAQRLSEVVVGKPTAYQNLTLYPLLAEGPDEPAYRLLDAALSDHSASVTQVAGSSRSALMFTNEGLRSVLLLNGDELVPVGSNLIWSLDRMVLAPAQQTILIHSLDRPSVGGTRWHGETREMLDAFIAAFTPLPGQCGALFAIGGRLMGLDLFDSPTTLAAALGKLVESYALAAVDADEAAAAKVPETPALWIEALAQAGVVEDSVEIGEGEDWRLFGSGVSGGALVRDGQVIRLSAFRVPVEDMTLLLATDRRLLRWRGQSQRYLHLRLLASHLALARERARETPHLRASHLSGERAPLDLALALDRSGSMGGDKWPRARDTALAAIDRLGPRDRIALVVFDDGIDTVLPLSFANADARAAASAALAQIGPRGNTNLGEGWLTACGLIGCEPPNDRLRRCFVLTDSQANVGITDAGTLTHHAAELRQLGVITSTFGVGDNYDELLLGALADAGGGAFHHIGSAEEIPVLLARELGDALEVVCRDVRVQLRWHKAPLGVEALGPWRADLESHSLTLQVGDLVSEQALDLLVAVSFPPGENDFHMLVLISDGNNDLAKDTMSWTYVDSERRKQQPRNGGVEQRVAEHYANQARFEAVMANRTGNLDRAREVLRSTAGWIRHYGRACPQALTLADALETEAEQHRRAFTAREVKEAIYETRNQIRGRNEYGARKRGSSSRPQSARTEPTLAYLPLEDGPELAARCSQAIRIPRAQAASLGESALAATERGFYMDADGRRVDWREAVTAAISAKQSLPPDAPLPPVGPPRFAVTRVQVVNAGTLAVGRRLRSTHQRVLALNFANGVQPGGGFLEGNRGQESLLCRSSALFATLSGDPMYAAHAARPLPDSTDWAILSPEVPVFRADDGTPLDPPWPLGILTCAAPYAPKLGQEAAAALMQTRIRRVLAIARAYRYTRLVLGAWGCGTYGNDPARIAAIFHAALKEQAGAFQTVVFAIADWSPERLFLTPFAAEFKADA